MGGVGIFDVRPVGMMCTLGGDGGFTGTLGGGAWVVGTLGGGAWVMGTLGGGAGVVVCLEGGVMLLIFAVMAENISLSSWIARSCASPGAS